VGLVFGLSLQARPRAHQVRPAKAQACSVKPKPDLSPHFTGPIRPYYVQRHEQGFKMSSRKKSPKMFFENYQSKTRSVKKSCQIFWATFAILKELAKENNSPIGENSSNLVTLATSSLVRFENKNILIILL
jgi:hypothetical protein